MNSILNKILMQYSVIQNDCADNIPDEKGSYILFFKTEEKKFITIGKLGKITIKPGIYVYIGSAFGPGGLRARIGRHLKKSKKVRWHIDYIRKELDIIDIYFSTRSEKLECIWAQEILNSGAGVLLKNLGSSDCKCMSHFLCISEL